MVGEAKHKRNNKQMWATKYRALSPSCKGTQMRWKGISRKMQFTGQTVIVTFHCENWKLTLGVLNHLQLIWYFCWEKKKKIYAVACTPGVRIQNVFLIRTIISEQYSLNKSFVGISSNKVFYSS